MIESLPSAVAGGLARAGLAGARIEPLTPDASDRRYYRAIPPAGEAVVLALHASPFEPGSLPFVQVAGLLAAVPLPVPRVRHEFPELGVLILDDLGDVTLQAHTASRPDGRHLALYEEAVDLLIRLQVRGAELADERLPPYRAAFDVEKLMWEMDFFLRHFLEGYCGAVYPAAEREALRRELLAIVEPLAAAPRVLCHRDYHSRNLMLHDGRLFVIDFQDARMGPDTYDLVSLLRDSYVELPSSMTDALIERFRRGRPSAEPADAFASRFRLMAVQRNLKALGTFGYQAVARANPVYAQYVPRTLDDVRATFEADDRFGRLRDMLGSRIAELR